ncbi:MAG: CHAT domain-containing protein [Pyrinomonadaceae bacterium]|nr:CHAT domain-containing protein [Acidobacteriota bacterium]MBP7376789.1 CHAT domain-containing protein [Pyrinomonadaceae bacterium]
MQRTELAKKLIDADADGRKTLLAENAKLSGVGLAAAIRNECIAAWSSDPERVRQCVAAARSLAHADRDAVVLANADWTGGIGEIIRGRFESAVAKLERAADAFAVAGNELDAAQTKVARLLALAMLGRYDDAIATGLSAIPILTKHGDELAAGKIEMNLSNIVSRRSQHREALTFCSSARKRFKKAREPKWQAMAENGLANTYGELNEFQKAEQFYALAFETAVAAKMRVTEAEIEASMGNLALFRGRYADALRYLELSRRKFDALAMPHQTAIADLEIAGIYSELNLNAEAVEIYERVCDEFKRLKLRAEEARSRLNYARAAIAGDGALIAKKQLKRALSLFTAEKNEPGQAAAMIAQARIALDVGDHAAALATARSTRKLLKRTQNARLPLTVGLLEGEAYLASGKLSQAKRIFESVVADAKCLRQPDAEQIALGFLGKTAVSSGDAKNAITYFKRSIAIVERLRAPLASEEFSMSFMAARLEPYDRLARVYLGENCIADAFRTIESGRSRALVDALDTETSSNDDSDEFSTDLAQIREELNSYYKRLDRAEADELAELNDAVRAREARVAKLTREIASVSSRRRGGGKAADRFSLRSLQERLGGGRSLIEFVEIDDSFSAFVVTDTKIRFVQDIATTSEVASALEDLHFQFGALRYGTAGMERFLGQMKARADACLASLYDQLLRPLEKMLSGGSLVVVPAGLLHYIPFHALYDDGYLAERFEVGYAPSAGVWSKLQERQTRKIEDSLLVGFADERIPLVEGEIDAVRRIVPKAKALVGEKATFSAFTRKAAGRDLIHLACHGQFRAENPMFSSLHLADGWVTVRDICEQRINAELVVLSACETGLNKVFAGDEILGLARGFLTAGAASLIVSLWTVNDAAASLLMQDLYREMQRGRTAAASLRKAQLNSIARGEHPYLWSPFVLIGR